MTSTHQQAPPDYAVVIPTIGRQSLQDLLGSLASQDGALPIEVVLADDRPASPPPVQVPTALTERVDVRILRSGGRGPAAARNAGWRSTTAPWVVFLDDDVLLPEGWATDLATDLAAAASDVAGVQSRLRVPLPQDRRPNDWERSTASLERSAWITADMAYRRDALIEVDGFDERFPRAYREDADLAFRVRRAGWRLSRGQRLTVHPVRPAPFWASVRVQCGNADDSLLRRLHGSRWRERLEVPRGRLPWHAVTVSSAALAAAGLLLRGRARDAVVVAGSTGWAAITLDLARRRIAPGPRNPREVARMAVTSVLIPPAAIAHRVRGAVRHRRAGPWPPAIEAILFDRDGTLIHDVPLNTDPARVAPLPDARKALDTARRHHLRTGVVTNQAAVGRGEISEDDVARINRRVEELLGPFDTWQVCHHASTDGCECRKPQPGMVFAAAADLGVSVSRCAVVGDVGSDVEAALAAGARPVLVPTRHTRPEEVLAAPLVAKSLATAVDLLLKGNLSGGNLSKGNGR